MKAIHNAMGSRNFIQNSAAITSGLIGLTCLNHPAHAAEFSSEDTSLFVIGPTEGYSTQIGRWYPC